jgi:WD40 repeat protein
MASIETIRRLNGKEMHCKSLRPLEGTRLASGGEDSRVRVWDVATGQDLLRLEGHTRPAFTVALDSQGKRLVSGDAGETVKVWDR